MMWCFVATLVSFVRLVVQIAFSFAYLKHEDHKAHQRLHEVFLWTHRRLRRGLRLIDLLSVHDVVF